MTDTNDKREFGKYQRFGRLKREMKQHKANCCKAQKIKEKIMELNYKQEYGYEFTGSNNKLCF